MQIHYDYVALRAVAPSGRYERGGLSYRQLRSLTLACKRLRLYRPSGGKCLLGRQGCNGGHVAASCDRLQAITIASPTGGGFEW